MFKQLLDVQVGDVYASFLVVVAVLATKCRPNIVQLMLCLTQYSKYLKSKSQHSYCEVNKHISLKTAYYTLFIKNVVIQWNEILQHEKSVSFLQRQVITIKLR